MTPVLHKTWCDEDEHTRYAHFADFNAWLDSEEGQAARIDYGVDALPQPSKALFAGDKKSYDEAFQAFRKALRPFLCNAPASEAMLLLFTRMTTVASGISVNVIRSPGFMARLSRISLGMVV